MSVTLGQHCDRVAYTVRPTQVPAQATNTCAVHDEFVVKAYPHSMPQAYTIQLMDILAELRERVKSNSEKDENPLDQREYLQLIVW